MSTPRPTWSRRSSTGIAPRQLYKDGIMASQDYDAKKAAYDLDVASLDQANAGLNQAKAQTESARGTSADARSPRFAPIRICSTRPSRRAPFDGIVTNEPVREGETVVEGIQNTEGVHADDSCRHERRHRRGEGG